MLVVERVAVGAGAGWPWRGVEGGGPDELLRLAVVFGVGFGFGFRGVRGGRWRGEGFVQGAVVAFVDVGDVDGGRWWWNQRYVDVP